MATTKQSDFDPAAFLAQLETEIEESAAPVTGGKAGRNGPQRPMPLTAEQSAILTLLRLAPTVGVSSGSRAYGTPAKGGPGNAATKAQAELQRRLIPDGEPMAIEVFCGLACKSWHPDVNDSPEDRFLGLVRSAVRLIGARLVWRQDGTIRATMDPKAGA